MAERRMMALSIVDSDAFLDLPLAAQSLYFHFNVRADDDGFLNNSKTIARMAGCGKEDLDALEDGGFIITFPDGIVCIRHWFVSNAIRKDRYTPTRYQEDRAMLDVDEAGVYQIHTEREKCEQPKESDDSGSPQPDGNQAATRRQPDGNQTATTGCQSGASGKDRLGKDRLGNVYIRACAREEPPENPQTQPIDLDEDSLRALFKSKAVADAMLSWLQVRSEQGRFPPGSIREAVERARIAENKHGQEKCVQTIKKAIEGGYKRIIWEELDRPEARGKPKAQGFRNFTERDYSASDIDALEQKILRAQGMGGG